ncbi:SDR family oxidoreductase [Ekhidna sp.]|uniref:SDR family oxidoreductase n=1 Tax=Ekhidna sp. TaxID=2608089 RepID=UPI003CCBC9BC
MNVLIIGANGKIGTILSNKLKGTPHQPIAMVRKEEQQKSFEEKGVGAVLADLEKDFDHAFEGVNAVVFTAGSGAHTGKDKTHLVDRVGAKKAIDLAVKHKVDRFIMISAFGADANPDKWPESMAHYYEAKADADKHLMQSGLDYTILMPGKLTDENGTNNIELGDKISQRSGSISRIDVATVIQKVLDNDNSIGKNLELLSGDTPIDEAVSRL